MTDQYVDRQSYDRIFDALLTGEADPLDRQNAIKITLGEMLGVWPDHIATEAKALTNAHEDTRWVRVPSGWQGIQRGAAWTVPLSTLAHPQAPESRVPDELK